MGTSPIETGAKHCVDNAVTYYPYLGAKVVGNFKLPYFYENF